MSGASPSPQSIRTLSIGGATYDLFLSMQKDLVAENGAIHLKIGHKLPVDRVTECAGGGACNTSVGLSRLGQNAAFCGIVGSDQWGEMLLATLQKERVDVSAATVVEKETSSFSIVLTLPSGERTILYTPGVNEHLQDATFDKAAMSRSDAVYLNHLYDSSCMIQDDIIASVLERPGIRLAWNPGGCQIESGMTHTETAALLKSTELLLLNKEEALKFTGAKTVQEALTRLSKAGTKNICVTDGGRGTYATDGTHVYHCPVLKGVTVVDTTGAGDAFGTAALWALLQGLGLQKAMMCGTLNAASVVGRIGAQAGLLTDTEILQKLEQQLLQTETVS